MKTATVRARIEPGLKKDVESLFEKLGLSATEAIQIFYRQIRLRQGLPFDVALPNAKTRQVFGETDKGKNLVRAKDSKDLFRKLGV